MSDEEEIELEFERAVDKVHTHTPYCPRCRNQITKVILRRKIRRPRPRPRPSPPPDRPSNLFGCLSCFTIFIPSGDGLNPFGFFGSKPKVEDVQSVQLDKDEEEAEHPTPHVTVDIQPTTDTTIHGRGNVDVDGSKTLEVLKCIVHGGLLESIASLSVVSSAAASDATTVNVVTIGLATLFSGLIAFGYSLLDFRNPVEKYEEALGKKGNFAFHSTFAIFSYLVFGFVAPTTYGFAFRESDNKDYKMIAVAAAGLACVLILAIAKAYVRGADKLKCILYYVTMAVSVSGVSYAAGDLIRMLLDKFGWFDPLTPSTPAWASY